MANHPSRRGRKQLQSQQQAAMASNATATKPSAPYEATMQKLSSLLVTGKRKTIKSLPAPIDVNIGRRSPSPLTPVIESQKNSSNINNNNGGGGKEMIFSPLLQHALMDSPTQSRSNGPLRSSSEFDLERHQHQQSLLGKPVALPSSNTTVSNNNNNSNSNNNNNPGSSNASEQRRGSRHERKPSKVGSIIVEQRRVSLTNAYKSAAAAATAAASAGSFSPTSASFPHAFKSMMHITASAAAAAAVAAAATQAEEDELIQSTLQARVRELEAQIEKEKAARLVAERRAEVLERELIEARKSLSTKEAKFAAEMKLVKEEFEKRLMNVKKHLGVEWAREAEDKIARWKLELQTIEKEYGVRVRKLSSEWKEAKQRELDAQYAKDYPKEMQLALYNTALKERERVEKILLDSQRQVELAKNRLQKIQRQRTSVYNQLPILLNNYQLLQLLGTGAFGEVWKARDLETAEEVAIKIQRPSPDATEQQVRDWRELILAEYRYQSSVQHGNVLGIRGIFEENMVNTSVSEDPSSSPSGIAKAAKTSGICMVFDLCDGGDLQQLMEERGAVPDRMVRLYLKEMLAACNEGCSKNSIVHGDIKPSNFLFKNGHLVLCDFGLANALKNGQRDGEVYSVGGTTGYMAPETAFGIHPVPISSKNDVYSLGVVVHQLLTGGLMPSAACINTNGKGLAGLASSVKQGKLSAEAADFIICCLQQRSTRPYIEQLLEHPYVANAEDAL